MIVINIQFLTLLGMSADEADAIARQPGSGGLSISYLFSFGGGGDRRSLEEARDAGATSLLLIGMADRYDCAAKLGIAVREICASGFGARRPTADEAAEIVAALEGSAHPAAAQIAELVRTSTGSAP